MAICGRVEKYFDVEGGNFKKAGIVSSQIKNILKDLGLASEIVRRVAIVSYESEINIVSYAKKGEIHLHVTDHSVRIEAADEGPGIPNIELAMKEGYSTAPPVVRSWGFGGGMGLANMKRFSDNFYISSQVGVGTRVRMLILNSNRLLHSDNTVISSPEIST
jgi:serine/threonine-protein kinase RsbT